MNLRDKLRDRRGQTDLLSGEYTPPPTSSQKKTGFKGLPQLDVNRRFLMLAAAAAGLASLMAVMYLNNSASGLSEGGTKIEVLVAAQDIKPGVKLTEDLLATRSIPKAYLPRGYYEDVEKLKDRLAIAPMVEGEPVIEARTSAPNAKYGIAYLLQPGELAKTISVDSASGLAGLIRPGNEVDLIATIPDPSNASRRIGARVVQRARVIASGNELLGQVQGDEEAQSHGGISSQGTITLAIPSGKISMLTLLEDLGNLKMVLRAAGDDHLEKQKFSDATIMSLVSGEVPKAEPKPQPKPQAVHPAPRRPVAHYVAPPRPRPAPVQPPKPKPKPQPNGGGVQVIQFGH